MVRNSCNMDCQRTYAYLMVCSGIVSAGALEASAGGSSSRPEIEPLFELPLRSTLLALLMNRESPGGLSPEPPAPPAVGVLMVGDIGLPDDLM